MKPLSLRTLALLTSVDLGYGRKRKALSALIVVVAILGIVNCSFAGGHCRYSPDSSFTYTGEPKIDLTYSHVSGVNEKQPINISSLKIKLEIVESHASGTSNIKLEAVVAKIIKASKIRLASHNESVDAILTLHVSVRPQGASYMSGGYLWTGGEAVTTASLQVASAEIIRSRCHISLPVSKSLMFHPDEFDDVISKYDCPQKSPAAGFAERSLHTAVLAILANINPQCVQNLLMKIDNDSYANTIFALPILLTHESPHFSPRQRKSIIKCLTRALRDSREEMQLSAIKALGCMRAREAMPEMLAKFREFVKFSDPIPAEIAAQALGHIGSLSNQMIFTFISILKQDVDFGIKWAICRALAETDGDLAPYANKLIPVLREQQHCYEVRIEAKRVLSRLGREE
jgi:hypothetical protein